MKGARKWSLSQMDGDWVSALAARLGSLDETRTIVNSDETKALEAASPLALRGELDVWSRMHENDRRAMGYLPSDKFEEVADRFVAGPAISLHGWETAEEAQRRILAYVDASLGGPQ